MKRIPDIGIVGEVALREAAATECGQVMSLVRAALQEKLAVSYVELEAMYPDRVVACRDGRYYAYPYTLGEDNKVVLGDPQEVIEQYLPVRMAEATESFLEAVDPVGKTWEVVIIRAGLSGNRNYYPDTALREAVALFEGARVLARSDEEHTKGTGKDARNIVGWLSGVRFVEGAATDTGRLMSTLNFGAGAGAAALRDNVTDAWKRGKRDLVGLSIDANAKTERRVVESKPVRYARQFTKVNSVDLIVEAGAGGALVRLVEAVNKEPDAMKQLMLAKIKAKAPTVYAQINPETITDAELEQRYAEAIAAEVADKKPAAAAGNAPAGVTAEQVAETVRMVEARAYLRTAVSTSKLPQAAQDKLLADWGKRERFTEAEVDTAIKAERTYVARFVESGKVKIDEAGNVQVEDRSVKIAGMFDAFFDPAHKDHRSVQSFKECYVEITGDTRVTGRIEHMDRSRLSESMGRMFESLDSTSFASVLGDSITRRLLADYRTPNQYDVWRALASIVPVSDFRTQDRTRFGGYGDLPAVLQGDPYAALASPTDEQATYAASKRGGTEDITLEMVKNDDVGAIRQIPIKLSRSAKRTLGKFVLDFIRTNPVIYDADNFFSVAHGNLGAAALDATALAARRLAMLKQTEAGSLDRLGIPAKNLVVPVDLQGTAVDLFKNLTSVNDKTFIQNLALTVIPVWYWTDATDWALTVDPMDMPWLEVGFLDGNEEPELFVQDQPNVGSMFSNDKITYKIRHIYGGAVTNFRGADKSVVAG
ncbi:MAG: hypothetical protein M0015_02910 [Betaproteobacteria bacterium]|nr:hypothetical protein [Betaproteobacteria bacterium]